MRSYHFIAALIPFGAFCDPLPKLSQWGSNVHSQFGEDGIIQKIFEVIGTGSKIAVEFGAADGFNCSNTANLWSKDPDWKGVLIEADPRLIDSLKANTASYNCIPLHRKIGLNGPDSIESILQEIGIGNDIDLLSIDIDGNDYYVLMSLDRLRPRILICEYNPSIPAHLDVFPEPDNYIGCSVAALQRAAAEKGYSLVAITDTNCFFVQNSDYPKFSGYDTDREHIRIDRYISYVISDYSGNYKVVGQGDFIQPWGWAGNPTPYPVQGNIKDLNRTVNQNR